MDTWPDSETAKQIEFDTRIDLIKRRIHTVYHQLSEIDYEHNDFGIPRRLTIIHKDLNEILDAITKEKGAKKLGFPSKKNMDFKNDLSSSYQELKSDLLKTADIFGVDVLSKNTIITKTPQINVNVIQSNVQDVKNIAEVINTINISEIKKEELKNLFKKLEDTAKNKDIEDDVKGNKLRSLFKEIVNLSLDAGIVGLRWANENGLINKMFGS